jgi:hypothetical protein
MVSTLIDERDACPIVQCDVVELKYGYSSANTAWQRSHLPLHSMERAFSARTTAPRMAIAMRSSVLKGTA